MRAHLDPAPCPQSTRSPTVGAQATRRRRAETGHRCWSEYGPDRREGSASRDYLPRVDGTEPAHDVTEVPRESGDEPRESKASWSGHRPTNEGPTSRTLSLSPGATQQASDLTPGMYVVAVEGLVQGEVKTFGERAGVTVTAEGQTTVVVDFLQEFVPTQVSTSPTSVDIGDTLTATWAPVSGADRYSVELSPSPDFVGAAVQETTETTTKLVVGTTGEHHIRVRAINRFDGVGRASEPSSVVAQKPIIWPTWETA